MASHFFEHTGRLVIEDQEHSMESVPLPGFQIIFNFSGKHWHRNWILPRNSTELESGIHSLICLPRKSIQFDLQTIISAKQKRLFNVLKKGLVGYRLPVRLREELAKYAAETAWDVLVSSMSPLNNRLNLNIRFCAVHKHVLYYRNPVIQESIESAGPGMIPSIEESIESLKYKIVDVYSLNESCSICLEDFEAGCEGVCMPCSHMFHGGCIKRWLRTSHYCPVCRFQMPTNS